MLIDSTKSRFKVQLERLLEYLDNNKLAVYMTSIRAIFSTWVFT
jgi:hypothetical protein